MKVAHPAASTYFTQAEMSLRRCVHVCGHEACSCRAELFSTESEPVACSLFPRLCVGCCEVKASRAARIQCLGKDSL